MVLAIQMHFLQDPQGWFAITCLSAIIGAAISFYDLKLIEERKQGVTGAAAELFDSVHQRQRTLVQIAPVTIINSFVEFGLTAFFPPSFCKSMGI